MSDYIKREDALDIVAHNCVNGEITLNRYDKIIDGIYEIPSADVAPVRHGHWIKNDPHCDGLAFLWNCSKCGAESEEGYRYCPACGARMDAKE